MRFLVQFWCRLSLSLLVVTSILLGQASAAPREGWVVIDTPMEYRVLVKRLNGAVKAEKMRVVTRASASSGAKSRKLVIPGNMIIGVYRNDFALRMLDASVDAGIEAPIRFYITEKANGGATLSYKRPGFVFAPYMATAKPQLKQLADELDAVFSAIALRATQPSK